MRWKERLIRFRSFWIFPALACLALILTRRYESSTRPMDLVWLFPSGLLAWTLLEYGLHRFAFHSEIPNAHMRHHNAPRDPTHILVYTGPALAVSALIGLGIAWLTRDLFRTAGIMSGIWAGFLYYESVHYRVHVSSAGGKCIAHQRRNHFHHHFRNARQGFGVTSPLWDYVFGTRPASD